jgi:hypothetical protein|eukprot:COSAG01_NODE_5754_length_4054_cov_28.824526_5_plen_119_part_00
MIMMRKMMRRLRGRRGEAAGYYIWQLLLVQRHVSHALGVHGVCWRLLCAEENVEPILETIGPIFAVPPTTKVGKTIQQVSVMSIGVQLARPAPAPAPPSLPSPPCMTHNTWLRGGSPL